VVDCSEELVLDVAEVAGGEVEFKPVMDKDKSMTMLPDA